jgi:hypothetical protein
MSLFEASNTFVQHPGTASPMTPIRPFADHNPVKEKKQTS